MSKKPMCRARGAAVAGLSAVLLLASGAANAGPPFRTDDPEPVEYQHWEVYGFSTGTVVRDDTSAVLPGVEVNYGVAPNVHLHVIAPLVYDKPSGGSAQYGVGDTELGVKYRFIQEDEEGWRPQVGVFPMVEVPTGDSERGLGSGHVQWVLPIWVQKSFGTWTTYGGGAYTINPGKDNKNVWFVGWLLGRHIGQLFFGGEVFHETADTFGGKDSTGFNLGGIYDVTEHHHALFSAGRGLQNVGDANQFSWYLGYQLTF